MSSTKPKIWIYRAYPIPNPCVDPPEVCVRKHREHFDILWYGDLEVRPELGEEISGAVVTFTTYRFFLQQKKHMPNLKVISNVGVGIDHMDVRGLNEEGIIVTNTPDIGSAAVADQAMALLLSAARVILPSDQWLRKHHTLHLFILGTEVHSSTLGIVGLGSIGYRTAQRALGFDMKVLYNQRNQLSKQEEDALGGAVYYRDLHKMLPLCDFLVLACPLTEETTNLIGAAEFALMKPTAILINVARGKIVNHTDLVAALSSKQILGAALDVTDPEPLPPGHPLLVMDNVVLTPHAGTSTFQTRGSMFEITADCLKAVLIDNCSPLHEIKYAD